MNKEQAYKQDRAKREIADLDKEIAFDVADATKKANDAVDRRNWETAKAFRENPTYLNFMLNFMRAFWLWGEKNEIEFWNVGIDGQKTTISANGKHIVLEACWTDKNPNPKTGEKKTDGGLIVPGGLS